MFPLSTLGHRRRACCRCQATTATDTMMSSPRRCFVDRCCRTPLTTGGRPICAVRGSGTRRKWQWTPQPEKWDPACRMRAQVSTVTRRERRDRDIWPMIGLLCRLFETEEEKKKNKCEKWTTWQLKKMNGERLSNHQQSKFCVVEKLTVGKVFISQPIDFNLWR